MRPLQKTPPQNPVWTPTSSCSTATTRSKASSVGLYKRTSFAAEGEGPKTLLFPKRELWKYVRAPEGIEKNFVPVMLLPRNHRLTHPSNVAQHSRLHTLGKTPCKFLPQGHFRLTVDKASAKRKGPFLGQRLQAFQCFLEAKNSLESIPKRPLKSIPRIKTFFSHAMSRKIIPQQSPLLLSQSGLNLLCLLLASCQMKGCDEERAYHPSSPLLSAFLKEISILEGMLSHPKK